jgi:hypothetical protein
MDNLLRVNLLMLKLTTQISLIQTVENSYQMALLTYNLKLVTLTALNIGELSSLIKLTEK